MPPVKIITKKIIYKLSYYFQIHRFLRNLNKNKVQILFYHGFSNEKNNFFSKFSDSKHLQIKKFHSQMKYLKNKYNIISLKQFVDSHKNGKKFPLYSLIITMDDGYLSNYSLAYPILKKLNIPATIFLTTSFVNQKEFLWMDRVEYALALARPNHYRLNVHDQKLLLDLRNDDLKLKSLKKIKSLIKSEPQGLRLKFIAELESLLKNKLTLNEKTPEIYLPLDWHQVQKMVEKELVSIGGHTHTHAILTKCSPKELKKELSLAKKIIEKNIKIKLLPFAYPNGTVKDFNKQIQSYLKQLNYSCALTTMSGFNNKKTDLFELRRIAVDDRMDWIEFIMNISGFRYLLLRLLKI